MQKQENPPFIPVARPWLEEQEAQAASRVILSGWVTQGPEVAAFEQEFAEYVGAEYACAVSSCATALHLALMAVGVRPGDEVITVSHSFIATANAVRHCGATPVFVDIQPDTFNIEPARIAEAITERARAILCVHQLGMPCDLATIISIAQEHKLAVIEDAACAIGSEIQWQEDWQKIGRPHGDIACFSFHPRKVITTGDGGMLTTANPEFDKQFRLWRQQGMSVPDTARHSAREVIFETYPIVGYNYRLTDIQAAVGREQLKRLPEMIAQRRLLAARYQALLVEVPGVQCPVEPLWAKSNWQSFCARLPTWADQRQVMQKMLDAGIATRRAVMCAHREAAYPQNTWRCASSNIGCDCPEATCRSLSASEQAQDHALILPLFHQMTEVEQERVVFVLKEALGES